MKTTHEAYGVAILEPPDTEHATAARDGVAEPARGGEVRGMTPRATRSRPARLRATIAGIVLPLALAGGAAAADDDDDAGWWRRDTLTGDWGGRRARLAQRGLSFEAVYTADVFSNRSGGASVGTESLYNFDLIVELDAEKRFGWTGVTLFFYGLGNHGGDPTERAGDAQVLDNIAAPEAVKVYELWAQVDLAERISMLAGLYDLNSEFDVIESAKLFINSSFGIGAEYSQSGRNGPSIFPTTSLAARFKYQPSTRAYIQGAAFDGVPGDPDDPRGTHVVLGGDDGLLLALEGGRLFRPRAPSLEALGRTRHRRIGRLDSWEQSAKLAAGAWAYTRRQDDLVQPGGPPRRSHSWGAYALAEARVFREASDPEQGLDVFGRAGVAASRVNRFGLYTGAGLTYTGLLPGRDGDQLGLAVAAAFNGDEFETERSLAGQPVDDAEVVVEATYMIDLLPWLSLQPDVQYIIDPDTDPTRDNALVVGLRLTVSF